MFVTAGAGIEAVDVASGEGVGTVPHPAGFHATSVACSQGIVAVAWAADDKHHRGKIALYDADDLSELATFEAGYLPDMLTFTADGCQLLVANEGEPTDDYAFDPPGSVTILTLAADLPQSQVDEATFTHFDSQQAELQRAGVRIFGPNRSHVGGVATVAQDLEPEYIALSADGTTAWIALQENDAIAELDLARREITHIFPLGLHDFRSVAGQGTGRLVSQAVVGTGLDVSDRDGGTRIRNWPILGMYQPDGIAAFHDGESDYLLTVNEGDPRDYTTYCEAVRIGDLTTEGVALDASNPARSLLSHPDLGRLEVSRSAGDQDGDGDLDRLVCFGTRSFSIWRRGAVGLEQVFDSGCDFEQQVARVAPHLFNVDSEPTSPPDGRSAKRGPEPESVALMQLGRHRLAAIGLERTGGVLFYDVTDPRTPEFLHYLHPAAEETRHDRAPEGLLFVAAEKNPSHRPLLIACNEMSGTMTAHALTLSEAE